MKRPFEINNFHSSSGGGPSTRPINQVQIEKRRELSLILTRRTRLRKKFFIESLQKGHGSTARKFGLKDFVKTKIPDADARNKITKDCNAASLLPSVVTGSCIEKEDFGKS